MATRIISLIIAVTFFLTTVGFSAYVIWENSREEDSPIDNSTSVEATNPENNQQQENENMLEGTQLQGFDPTTERVAELQIEDIVEGTGEPVAPGTNVTVHYTGALVSTGEIFQSSKDFGEPISFGLDGLIQGWQEGIPGMKPGGVRRLTIPAAKAYGEAGSGNIPGDADLVFDIELISVAE